jgi:hypothetical protein
MVYPISDKHRVNYPHICDDGKAPQGFRAVWYIPYKTI